MFRRSRELVIPARAALQGLRPSLNEPIVRIDGLPAAPARAAIALFDGGYGELALAVALRSRDASEAICFVHQEPIPIEQTVEQSLDVGVAFAEGMGFLFDDDIVSRGGDQGRLDAATLWEALLGVAPSVPTGAVSIDGPVELEELELAEPLGPGDFLDDEILELDDGSIFDEPIELADRPPLAAEPPPQRRATDHPARTQVTPEAESMPKASLTKFRGPPVIDRPAGEDGAKSGGSSRLGRVAIVRRRVGNGDRPSGLIRLLANY